MKRIAVFCGSSSGNNPAYLEAAKALGKKLAEENIEVVYGGAQVGLMGAVANSAMKAGGKVIGVIPKKLVTKEIAHNQLTELHIVEGMHERKAMMAELSDAFIALPGGSGTLEEWFEVLTWAQIGYHKKQCSLLNTNNYYTPLLSLFDHMIGEGFVAEKYRELIIVETEVNELLIKLKKHPIS